MSFLCSSVVLFMLINAAFCCSPPQASILVNDLTSPCVKAGGVALEYSRRRINCGHLVHYNELFEAPLFHYSRAVEHKTYTLLLITSDTPGSDLNALRFFLHWAVTGISGSRLRNENSGPLPPSPMVYLPPHALYGTFHYKFVLLEEVSGQPSLDPRMSRHGFDLRMFLARNNMCSSAVAMYEIEVDA